jgi:hypothetical protein
MALAVAIGLTACSGAPIIVSFDHAADAGQADADPPAVDSGNPSRDSGMPDSGAPGIDSGAQIDSATVDSGHPDTGFDAGPACPYAPATPDPTNTRCRFEDFSESQIYCKPGCGTVGLYCFSDDGGVPAPPMPGCSLSTLQSGGGVFGYCCPNTQCVQSTIFSSNCGPATEYLCPNTENDAGTSPPVPYPYCTLSNDDNGISVWCC